MTNPDTPPSSPQPSTSSPKCIDSQSLFQGATAIEINHAGQRYLLRVTRENKLILTK